MNFYNENDPKAAAWLRELIRVGEIPAGIVDERSITEIKPDELSTFVQCHFFAGIGGWSYALKLAGWPEDKPVWTGSCPCQPFSVAGKGMGEADERHLWPFFRNLIGECGPATVFGEQVAKIAGRKWLAGIRAEMERAGYAFGASDLCAAGVASPHNRARHYWVAESKSQGRSGMESKREAGERERSRAGSGGTNGRMDNPMQRRRGEGGNSIRSGRSSAGVSGEIIGVEHANGSGRPARESAAAIARHGLPAESASGLVGVALGDTDIAGSQGRRERNGGAGKLPARSAGAWSDYRIVICRDPKGGPDIPRRVESGSFPLAHGVSGRVGLLRGYGNAIVPQVAAEFIKATGLI